MADTKAQAQRIEARLDDAIAKLQRAQKLTVTIGIVLMVVIGGYFSWLRSMVSDLVTPQSISDLTVGAIEREIPKQTDKLSKDLVANADKYVNKTVDEMLKAIPEGRKNAEKFVHEETSAMLTKVHDGFSEVAEVAYAENAEELRQFVKDLNTPDGAKGIEDALYDALTEPLMTSNVQTDLRSLSEALINMNRKLEHLLRQENLSKSEQIERELIVALKELSKRSP
ncbi:hypothetical protein HZA57_04140 [Candidatus Poribacteria bacterium]|nr:hypothetical protein [Candidatus Poribacteria bacterium]